MVWTPSHFGQAAEGKQAENASVPAHDEQFQVHHFHPYQIAPGLAGHDELAALVFARLPRLAFDAGWCRTGPLPFGLSWATDKMRLAAFSVTFVIILAQRSVRMVLNPSKEGWSVVEVKGRRMGRVFVCVAR